MKRVALTLGVAVILTASLPAGQAGAARPIDPITRAVMRRYGMTPETRLFRAVKPSSVRHLNTRDMRVAGNLSSLAASLENVYNTHPKARRYVSAREAGKGLNVTVGPSAYGKGNRVSYSIKVGDILARGGRIYPDRGALKSHKALYVTFEGSVPFRWE
jgi:hypothetical protein